MKIRTFIGLTIVSSAIAGLTYEFVLKDETKKVVKENFKYIYNNIKKIQNNLRIIDNEYIKEDEILYHQEQIRKQWDSL